MSCLFCMTKLMSMTILIAYCVYLLVNLKSCQRQCMFCSENLYIFLSRYVSGVLFDVLHDVWYFICLYVCLFTLGCISVHFRFVISFEYLKLVYFLWSRNRIYYGF